MLTIFQRGVRRSSQEKCYEHNKASVIYKFSIALHVLHTLNSSPC